MKLRNLTRIAGAVAVLAAFGMQARAQELNGAGATFPAPIYQHWFQEYGQKTGVKINYQPIGSGGGIQRITAKAVDFGASDAPMNDAELAKAPGILHIPTVAGAVVVSYNIPGVGPGIRLTPDVLADIFLGKITNWSDPRISKINPGTAFPSVGITPFHRSDSSGTTNIFTNYLTQVSGDWKDQVGPGKAVKWPKGLGGKGNAGVAALVKQTDGGIGYIELAFAVTNNISYAAIRNQKGKFIYPDVKSTTVAASAVTLPADFRKVIVNTAAPEGYPITGFTFLLIYPDAKPELKKFLLWALTDGEKEAADMYYAPLPDNVRNRALAVVNSLH